MIAGVIMKEAGTKKVDSFLLIFDTVFSQFGRQD